MPHIFIRHPEGGREQHYFCDEEEFTEEQFRAIVRTRTDCECRDCRAAQRRTVDPNDCANCGRNFDMASIGGRAAANGAIYCPTCTMHLRRCASCGGEDVMNQMHRNQHWQFWCHDCFNRFCAACDWCSNTMLREDAHRHGGAEYCNDCWENSSECHECGTRHQRNDLEWEDDEDDEDGEIGICRSCQRAAGGIHDYSFKPAPKFHGRGPLYLGFENEVEAGNGKANYQVQKDAKALTEAIGGLIYCKHDGSIENGFEVVSHPLSYDWLKENRAALDPMFALAQEKGYRSWNTTTCGMHVHLSKDAFTGLHLYRFLRLFYEFPDWTYKMSRRRSREALDRWASCEPHEGLARLAKNKTAWDSPRYAAVNLLPKQTVEVRIFRGTLRKQSFFSNLELCQAAFDFTKGCGITEASPENFATWLRSQTKQYPNLAAHLGIIHTPAEELALATTSTEQ